MQSSIVPAGPVLQDFNDNASNGLGQVNNTYPCGELMPTLRVSERGEIHEEHDEGHEHDDESHRKPQGLSRFSST